MIVFMVCWLVVLLVVLVDRTAARLGRGVSKPAVTRRGRGGRRYGAVTRRRRGRSAVRCCGRRYGDGYRLSGLVGVRRMKPGAYHSEFQFIRVLSDEKLAALCGFGQSFMSFVSLKCAVAQQLDAIVVSAG